ncbi:PIN domain-containing protein [Streptomyces chartreusis]|uniref:PIN domain-containing protein n=1 Tax=Streptomyces chartreusis TaxID=1969 RepID=UPI003669A2C6
MIILDTSILRTFSPESSSADLLVAIRRLDAERVAVPWMVIEELAAQQAIKYREKYDKAAEALRAVQDLTPWQMNAELPPSEADEYAKHWRTKWATIVEVIVTSDAATREALLREANCRPPCNTVKGIKTGARDAAIWLSAVEYARQHPQEIVCFVSDNTTDFGRGAPYPSPMAEDLAGMEERFVHLTSMDEVVARFAEPTTTDASVAARVLGSPGAQDAVAVASHETLGLPLGLPLDGSFACTIASGLAGEAFTVPALGWATKKAVFDAVESMQSYRIGDEEWCTAVVRWTLGGVVVTEAQPGAAWAGCSWTTAVLFTLDDAEPRLSVLRSEAPTPIGVDAFDALGFALEPSTALEQAVGELVAHEPWHWSQRRLGLQLPYTGALMRKAYAQRIIDVVSG